MRYPFVLLACATLAAPLAAIAGVDCEPARCVVQQQIDATCPCDASSNHGRYVSCVAHVVRRLSQDGAIPTSCSGKVVRCAARSTCGKDGFVACRIPTDTCDPTTLTCTGNPALACATDLDCGSRCKVSRSADQCTALGGTAGGGSCCATCGG